MIIVGFLRNAGTTPSRSNWKGSKCFSVGFSMSLVGTFMAKQTLTGSLLECLDPPMLDQTKRRQTLAWRSLYLRKPSLVAVSAKSTLRRRLSIWCSIDGFLSLKAPITTAADDTIWNDISWESSAGRRFSWNIMPLLLLKKQQHLKLSSAANSRWRFMGLNNWVSI